MNKNIILKVYNKVVAIMLICVMAIAPCVVTPQTVKADDFATTLSKFPAGYRKALQKLHNKYPNWKFVPYNTGLEFNKVVDSEYANNRSLVHNSANALLKSNASGHYNKTTKQYIPVDAGSWVVTSKNTIAHFIDTRMFLDEENIFMFESLSYDSTGQTQAGVESILQGSFMYKTNIGYVDTKGKYISTNIKYSKQIMDAAKASGVSEYHLASKIIQEVGRSKNSKYAGMGGNGSVCGTYSSKYTGYYNFYNIGAYSGADPVANGLNYAKSGSSYQRPWNTPMKAISGGAKVIGETYINCGQNTNYYQKFNVNSASKYGLYNHQYMTNIYASPVAASLAADVYKSQKITALQKTFIIPVYKKMPYKALKVTLGDATKKGKTTDSVNLRKGPGTTYDTVKTLAKGQAITVKEGKLTKMPFGTRWLANPYWFKVSAKVGGKTYSGYLSPTYIQLNTEMNVFKDVKIELPRTVEKSGKIYYRSDNPAIATVDGSGNVTGKKKGSVTIFALGSTGSISGIRVKVNTEGVVLNKTKLTLYAHQSKKLKATVYPTNAKDKTVKYSSSNTKVATVTSAGKVKAIAPGTAKITAKPAVGASMKCTVTVKPAQPTAPKLKVKNSNYNTLKLSWTKDKTATGYVILRTTGNKEFKPIKYLDKNHNSYSDTKLKTGRKYKYKVSTYRTISKVNYYSSASNIVTIAPSLNKPKYSIARNNKGVIIKMQSVKGAQGFKIYQSTRKDKGFKKVAKIKVKSGSKSKLQKQIKKLKIGNTYYYKVRAYRTVSKKKVYSVYSKVKSIKYR